MANPLGPTSLEVNSLVHPRKTQIRGDLVMEGRSSSQAHKFRKVPAGCVLRKEREGLHLFHLSKGEIIQVSETASQDQREEN